MINFTEGRISLGEKYISVFSDSKDMCAFAENGLIEKREHTRGLYYYLEVEEESMRFSVFIELQDNRVKWILLRWLDRPMKSWDDVSEKAMADEYRLLSNFLKKQLGASPDNIKTVTRTWHFKWGQINLSYEVRSFDVGIFMKPR